MLAFLSVSGIPTEAVLAQNATPATVEPAPAAATTRSPFSIAQAPPIERAAPNVPSPSILPTDITPTVFGDEKGFMSRDMRFKLLKKLPTNLWFNSSVEVSQRLETNPLATARRAEPDYVFRVLPNVSLGYNVLKRTGIYCNYFVIKDVFARHHLFSRPTFQSLSLGVRQDIPLGSRTNAQLDFQARELWQVSHLRQADLLPSFTVTHAVTPNFVLFGNTILQMRSGDYFQGATRELDPFYSAGFLWRRGAWTFLASHTYVTNFRYNDAIPRQSNQTMISDYEISRPVLSKIPNVVAFIRAEPVWNFDSHRTPGLSGMDFRLFAGFRATGVKRAYGNELENLREQIKDMEDPESEPNKQPLKQKATPSS